jgi:hydrogenase maturation protease
VASRTKTRKPLRISKHKTAIIGVGNPLMGDDAAGILVLKMLIGKRLLRGIEIVDAGTGGMTLLHLLAKYNAVVIVDAVDMGLKPGELRTFSPDDAISLKEKRKFTLHNADILEIIMLAKQLGQCPSKITICAIQPRTIRPARGLSREVSDKMPDLAARVLMSVGPMQRAKKTQMRRSAQGKN